MSKAKFEITEWNHKGFEEILCSSGAQKACESVGRQIQERANQGLRAKDTPGFLTSGSVKRAYGSDRWMEFVYTSDAATMFAERDENVLTKAVK